MKSVITLFSTLLLFALTTKAQTNKVDNTINKANNSVNSANTSVNNASATGTNAVSTAANTAGQAKNLAGQVGNLFGKKPADGTVNTTTITVKGGKFSDLKKLNESILTCSNVQDAKMKFSADGSTITVTHTGSTSKLLKAIQKKSTIITDDNIDNLDEGVIAFTVK